MQPAVIVTEATQGLSVALARQFARQGHALLLVGSEIRKLAVIANQLRGDFGTQVRYIETDLSKSLGGDEVEQALVRCGFTADTLINNTPHFGSGVFLHEDQETLQRIVDFDIKAALDLTLRFLPAMVARGRGAVMNVASFEGFLRRPHRATYAAAMALLISFTRDLAHQMKDTGVQISVFAPYLPQIAAQGLTEQYYQKIARSAYRRFRNGEIVITEPRFGRVVAETERLVPQLVVQWLRRIKRDFSA